MTTSSVRTERYRLEVGRATEPLETHGFFESLLLAEQAAEGDIDGSGDRLLHSWTGPDESAHWMAEATGARYRITHELEPVTTAPQYQPLMAQHLHCPMSDNQIRLAVQMGLDASPRTAQLHVDVDCMDHRVFLSGHVHDTSDARLAEQAAAHVADVGEVVDLLDVECC